MKTYYHTITLTSVLGSCTLQPIKRTPKPTPELLIETLCESETDVFHYYRTYSNSDTTPSWEIIDQGDNGSLDYIKINDMWSILKTNNTPKTIRKDKIITQTNCKEKYDPLGKPMKTYWESKFFSNYK